jgi:hypothetical protein
MAVIAAANEITDWTKKAGVGPEFGVVVEDMLRSWSVAAPVTSG